MGNLEPSIGGEMSLKKSIRKATRRAFQALTPLKEQIVYHRLGAATYDIATKSVERETIEERTVTAFLTSYKTEEILAGLASPENQRVTIERSSIDFEPSIDDEIEVNNEVYRVVEISREMSDSVINIKIEQR